MVTKMLIEDVSTLLMKLKDCCRSRSAAVLMSQLPLQLSDRVPVVDVAAAVVFRLHLEGRVCWE